MAQNPGEVTLRAYRSLPGDILGRSLSKSIRNAPLKTYVRTYYTPVAL
jgi:hypothetical protein